MNCLFSPRVILLYSLSLILIGAVYTSSINENESLEYWELENSKVHLQVPEHVLVRVKRARPNRNKVPTRRQQQKIDNGKRSSIRAPANRPLNNRYGGTQPNANYNPKNLLKEKNYPAIIKQGGREQTKVLTNFGKSLTKSNQEAKKYDSLTAKHQETKRNYAHGTEPIFERIGPGSNKQPNKGSEFMIGAMQVNFKNSGVKPIKILSNSGGQIINKQKHTPDQYGKGLPGTKLPMKYTDSNTGFKFANIKGSKDKPITNVLTGAQTGAKCTTDCTAQKLMTTVSEHIQKNPTHKVKDISMTEVWYKAPGTVSENRNWDQNRAVQSCASCKKTLPKFFGQLTRRK